MKTCKNDTYRDEPCRLMQRHQNLKELPGHADETYFTGVG